MPSTLSLLVITAHALRRCNGTPASLARVSGLDLASVHAALSFMAHNGYAVNDNGRWALTDAAREVA